VLARASCRYWIRLHAVVGRRGETRLPPKFHSFAASPSLCATMARMVSLRIGTVSASHYNLASIWLVLLATQFQKAVGNQPLIANLSPLPIHLQQHYALGLSSPHQDHFRGGSSAWGLTEPEHDPYRPPETRLEHMSLALRLTGELNRRLHAGTRHRKEQETFQYEHNINEHEHDEYAHRSSSSLHSSRITEPLRGGDSTFMNMQEQSQVPPPPPPPPPPLYLPKIRGTSDTTTTTMPLTVFHAKSPRTSKKGGVTRRGAARWGPDLLTYLRHLAEVMGLSEEESSLEFAMAMIYLDRACSVETSRNNGMLPCPFCTPRTVHRLCLTAMLVATQAVRGTTLEEYYPGRLESLGIPLPQLQQMVDWMTGALGDLGLFLTPGQMAEWRNMWEYKFPSSSSSSSSTQQQAHLPQVPPLSNSNSAPQKDLEAQGSLAGDGGYYPQDDQQERNHQYPSTRNAVGVE
jgi:hypothetical protein